MAERDDEDSDEGGWLSVVGDVVFRKGGGMEGWRWWCGGGGDGALEVLEMCWRCNRD